MKAAVLTAPRTLEITDAWPEPECGPDDVVVRIEGVGLCGSDLALFEGRRPAPAQPWLVGHEGFGRVVAVGARAADLRQAGERVVIEPNYACLECPDCARGLTSACARRAIVGMNVPGVMAELVAVPAVFAHPVGSFAPDAPPSALAALACAEPYTVARTAARRSGITEGERALVTGAGAQGLLLCQALLARGVRPVVVEPHPERLARAVRVGAEAVADGEDGFGFVFETSGAEAALKDALGRAAAGATVTVVGLSATPLPLTMEQLVRSQFTLRGSLIYDHPGDFRAALDDISAERVRPGEVIGAGFPLERAQEAFSGARERAGKTWVHTAPAGGPEAAPAH